MYLIKLNNMSGKTSVTIRDSKRNSDFHATYYTVKDYLTSMISKKFPDYAKMQILTSDIEGITFKELENTSFYNVTASKALTPSEIAVMILGQRKNSIVQVVPWEVKK